MKTILVVDDERSIVELLTAVLEDEGYHVVTAHNGKEGLARLPISQPSMVLCDVMMPILDGREMCQRMQANPEYRSIPIVLMSAAARSGGLADCTYAALLSKPFDLDDVLNTVDRVLSHSKSA
jgi:CheY-like chemotaxis protein